MTHIYDSYLWLISMTHIYDSYLWLIESVTGLTPLSNGQNGPDEDFNDGWTFFLVTNHQIKCNKVSHTQSLKQYES